MELDHMKAVWSELDRQLPVQQTITDENILKMARRRPGSRLRRIIVAESIGVFMCAAALVYLFFHFRLLDNWLNLIGGLGTVLILLLSIAMGGRIIRQAKRIDIVKNSYNQTLEDFGKLKKTLAFYKKMSIAVNLLFPFFVLPVGFKLFLNKDLLTDLPRFGMALLACLVLMPPVLFVLIRFYRNNIREVRAAIEDKKKV